MKHNYEVKVEVISRQEKPPCILHPLEIYNHIEVLSQIINHNVPVKHDTDNPFKIRSQNYEVGGGSGGGGRYEGDGVV